MAIITRAEKGSQLTFAELDGNFTQLVADISVKADTTDVDAAVLNLQTQIDELPFSVTTIAALRLNTTPLINHIYQTTDIQGEWYYDSADVTSPDNTGTILVSGTYRFKRVTAGNTALNVRWFGALGNGVADDRPAIEKCLNYAKVLVATQPVEVYIPTGRYALLSKGTEIPYGFSYIPNIGFSLPVNITNNFLIKGDGPGQTIFILNNLCRSLFWFKKVADWDHVRNFTITGFDVDNNNTVGKCSIIGNRIEDRVSIYNLWFENIIISNINMYNAPVDPNEAVVKPCIFFDGTQSADYVPSETFNAETTNITIEHVHAVGFHSHTLICANAGSVARLCSHFYDNINIVNCSHIVTAPPAKQVFHTSFFVCGNGRGDRYAIVNCYSKNIGDDAIEVGNMKTGLIQNFTSENALLWCVLMRNSWNFTDAELENHVTIIDNVKCITDKELKQSIGSKCFGVGILANDSATGGNKYGHVVINNFLWQREGILQSKVDSTALVFPLGMGTAKSVTFSNIIIDIQDYVYDLTTPGELVSIFEVRNTTIPGVFNINNVSVKLNATAAATVGSGYIDFTVIRVDQPSLVNISGVVADFSGITSNKIFTTILMVGKTGGFSGARLNVEKIFLKAISTVARVYGVRLYGSSTITFFKIDNCDFTKNNNVGKDVDLTSANANLPRFKASNISMHTGNLFWPTEVLTVVATLDFPITPVNAYSELPVAFAGAETTDYVNLEIPASAVLPFSTYTASVTALNVVTVRFTNLSTSSGPLDPPSSDFKLWILK